MRKVRSDCTVDALKKMRGLSLGRLVILMDVMLAVIRSKELFKGDFFLYLTSMLSENRPNMIRSNRPLRVN